ncbi:MAG: hypothetical protein P8X81_13555, partial [Woeseiaceae bacterium]
GLVQQQTQEDGSMPWRYSIGFLLTGQQFQSELCEPYYVTFFEDFTMVKFYRISLLEVCETERSRRYEGFSHVENWSPGD